MDCRIARSLTMVCMVSLGACSSSTRSASDGSPDGVRGGIDATDARATQPGLVDSAVPSNDVWGELPPPDALAPDLDVSDAPMPDAGLPDALPLDVVVPDAPMPDADLPDAPLPGGDDASVVDAPKVVDAVADRVYPADQSLLADRPETGDASQGDRMVTPVDGGGEVGGVNCATVPGHDCTAGQVDTRACGASVGVCKAGTQRRTCTATCLWSAWSACGGSYVGPKPELCGDGLDNDCDGKSDEGCACNPVAPGAASSLTVSETLGKLVPDPSTCLLYALTTAAPSELVVFDTAHKQEMIRVNLGGLAKDLDLSPDGTHLVVGLGSLKQIAVINKSSWTVTPLSTKYDVDIVEVANSGATYYFSVTGAQIQGIDLNLGPASEVTVVPAIVFSPDLELSADGTSLFYGESGGTGCNIYRSDLATTPAKDKDQSRWDDGYGFLFPKRHVYLGPNGKHIYFADHRLDANQLALTIGSSGQVFAEDAAATFAVSATGIVDAELLTSLATFPSAISAAALTAADHELWYYSQTTGQLAYANVADFIAGKSIGVRESAAGPISDYKFTKLVADPNRPVLYGLDATKRAVVSIDRQSGQALQSVVVGSQPVDLEIDASGVTLYTGHLDSLALAQIDAKNLTFGRFITTPRVTNDIAPLAGGRIATIDEDQWTSPTLIDLVTGNTLDYKDWANYGGALAATADGNTLFVNDTGGMTSISRYDVSAGKLRLVAHNEDYGGGSGLVITPDGSSVYTYGRCLDGANLSTIRYGTSNRIYSVSPNGKLAIGSWNVYRVADGTMLADLGGDCSVHAVSPDSSTLYCARSGGIVTFPLGGLE